MPRPRKSFPTPRQHKGAAVIDLYQGGRRRTITLGPWDSEHAKREFARLLAESQSVAGPTTPGSDITVNEILVRFLDHAEGHYRREDGTPTNEVNQFKQTFRPLRDLYGHIPAREFGPRSLKVVRDRMIAIGWARRLINQRLGRIKQVFKWAASDELISVVVHDALKTVAGLRLGAVKTRETEPIRPVAEEHVVATLPFLGPVVQAMVRVQLLTGMRPDEVCCLRPQEMDTGGAAWVYRPRQHKTRHRGKEKVVAVGPKAQVILAQYAPPNPLEYYFSPQRAAEQFHAARGASRKTPKYPSHLRRNETKRVAAPKRKPGAKYLLTSYEHAIARAVKRANRERARVAAVTGLESFEAIPHWAPNQLRHTRGTQVREEYGLEAAQVVLGHERADVTQMYALKNQALAVKVASETG